MNYQFPSLLKYGFALAFLSLTACTKKANNEISVEVSNNLDFQRKEIVSIDSKQLAGLLKDNKEKDIRIKKEGTVECMVLQWVDNDRDGKGDELLFQADVTANGISKYVILIDSTVALPKSKRTTYSRFVPERTDDYAWENNKVGFRTYGPDAQKRIEQNIEGGTLSSGIDIWLKKIEYPVIDKWYAENVKSVGYYHIDHGEGYDPYHVGASRGNGGIGVWEKDSLYVSKNFISYKTIAVGPLRTIFDLSYAPWSEYGIQETKRISLDLDSNFSKFEISLTSDKKVPDYTIGITLHDNKGEAKISKEQGIARHWEPIDDAFVGEGIVIDPAIVDSAFAHVSQTKDQSNILVVTHPEDNKLTYYAGFAWTKSRQVKDVAGWDAMLIKQQQIVANPLKVMVK